MKNLSSSRSRRRGLEKRTPRMNTKMNTFSFVLQARLIQRQQASSCVSGATMSISVMRNALLSASVAALSLPLALAQQSSSVKLIHTVNLPGYSGDFDHFAVDYDRNRLLLAAEDHGSLEVFDLQTSAHLSTIPGFGNPHSILVRKGSPTVLITDSEKQGAT